MTADMIQKFTNRILSVTENDNAKFGKMNAVQMICHCADQLRMAFGEIKGLKRQNIDLAKLREMKLKNETVPTVDGLDQVAGDGTKSTGLANDKKILIDYLKRFNQCDEDFKFSFHPYFGEIDKAKWEQLVIYHLDHHLDQFGR